jgi:hypothetical protein
MFHALLVHLIQLLRATFVRAYPREHLTISLLSWRSWKDAVPSCYPLLCGTSPCGPDYHCGKCSLPSPFTIVLPHVGREGELTSSCIVANTAYEQGEVHPPNDNLRTNVGQAQLFDSILGWLVSCSAYSCAGVFPASFASAQARCNATACSAGDLIPSMTSRKPVYITLLKFCGARTSML